MISQIDNVGIATHNRTRSVAFYQKLGFGKAFENERGYLLVAGTGSLFVFDASADSRPRLRVPVLLMVRDPDGDNLYLLNWLR